MSNFSRTYIYFCLKRQQETNRKTGRKCIWYVFWSSSISSLFSSFKVLLNKVFFHYSSWYLSSTIIEHFCPLPLSCTVHLTKNVSKQCSSQAFEWIMKRGVSSDMYIDHWANAGQRSDFFSHKQYNNCSWLSRCIAKAKLFGYVVVWNVSMQEDYLFVTYWVIVNVICSPVHSNITILTKKNPLSSRCGRCPEKLFHGYLRW